jgi:hypothetical protein
MGLTTVLAAISVELLIPLLLLYWLWRVWPRNSDDD